MHSLVDLDKYPIDNPESEQVIQFINKCRETYTSTGLCMLPDFIRPEMLEKIATETNQYAINAYFCKSTHNAYLTDSDESMDAKDIRNQQE